MDSPPVSTPLSRLSVIPVTTRSPSFNPSAISVATPSLIPVLIVTFVGFDALGGKT